MLKSLKINLDNHIPDFDSENVNFQATNENFKKSLKILGIQPSHVKSFDWLNQMIDIIIYNVSKIQKSAAKCYLIFFIKQI